MKIRNGFASNSSSSSFTIQLEDISGKHVQQIYDHHTMAGDWPWDIWTEECLIRGYTFMDNFDMHYYLVSIGIDMDKVSWGD